MLQETGLYFRSTVKTFNPSRLYMEEWEEVRDQVALDYISELGDSSYDFVARDVWLKNGVKADLLKYRHQSQEFKVLGVYEPSGEENIEGEEAVDALRDIGEMLYSEGFRYEISTKRTDNFRNQFNCILEGDYYFSSDFSIEDIISEVGHLFGSGEFPADYEEIKCKE